MSNTNQKTNPLTLSENEIREALIKAYFDGEAKTIEDEHALKFLQEVAIFNIQELKNNNL